MIKTVSDLIKELQSLPLESEVSAEIKVVVRMIGVTKTVIRNISYTYKKGDKVIIALEDVTLL